MSPQELVRDFDAHIKQILIEDPAISDSKIISYAALKTFHKNFVDGDNLMEFFYAMAYSGILIDYIMLYKLAGIK